MVEENNNQNQQQQNQTPPAGGNQTPPASNQQQQQSPALDLDKLASIVAGKQQVAEDTVLKNYFKNQGLSQEEAAAAIKAFKDEKAKNTPDPNALQTQLQQATALAQQATVEKEATLEAIALGIDSKTIPYVLKLADLSKVLDKDGKVDAEAMKTAINKVLEDVPQLKGQAEEQRGFQIGGNGNAGNGGNAGQQQQKAVATKKWNRFNN